MSLYHVAKPDGSRVGPFDVETLNTMLADGQLEPTCQVWTEGQADWAPISTVATVPTPPASPAAPAVPPTPAAGTPAQWDLISAFRSVVFERYATFSGRASRAEYWWYFLASFLVGMVLGMIPLVGWLLSLAFIIPGLAVCVRRLHDAGHSGWCVLLSLIPLVGGIILLVFLLQASAPANKWGEGPAVPSKK